MAYKFQAGAAQMSGALTQEGAFKLHNEAGSEVASVLQSGIVSGSAAGKFSTLSIDSVQVFSDAQQLQNVASLDATSEATIESAIDTLANLTSAGATGVDLDVLGPLDVQEGIKQNGTEILSDAGALKALASVSGSGAFQGGSAAFGTSVTAGTSFIIGSADLNEADMEKLDGITNGTAVASKAVVLDASANTTGISQLTASYFAGNGSGITNIDVGNLDATGADQEVQFNQNGEFGASAGLKYSGTGSLILSASSAGSQTSDLVFGTTASPVARLRVFDDDGAYAALEVNGGFDLSGSDGFFFKQAPEADSWFVSEGNTSVQIGDMVGNAAVSLSNAGVISGSGALQVAGAAALNSTLDVQGGLTAVGALSNFAAVTASGVLTIESTLTAASLGNATIDLTADLMVIDDGAAGSIKTTSLAQYATAIGGAGLSSSAGALLIVNSPNGGIQGGADSINIDFNDLSAAAVNVAADSFAFLDADGNVTQKESIADLVTAMAGAGLTATNGVLSTDAGVAPNAIGDAAEAMVEGFNYGSADLTVARIWTMPAPAELGDIVHVKAPANCSSTLTISIEGATIDGVSAVLLESPYAAVSLICVDVGSDLWRLY